MDHQATKRPRWVAEADALTLGLAALACFVFLTGGGRWRIAGVLASLTSAARLTTLAGIVAVVRHAAFPTDPLWPRLARATIGRAPVAEHGRSHRTVTHAWVLWMLGACVLLYLVNDTIWLANDASSPSFDKAAQAGFALKFLRLFRDPAHLSVGRLLDVTQYWPPFFHLCSVPFTAADRTD